MKNLKSLINLAIVMLIIISCKNNNSETIKTSELNSVGNIDITGNYVDGNYLERNQGADWVAVSVSYLSDSTISISVRSRADKKKPTCTFDATANKINDTVYKTIAENQVILFKFTSKTISISTQNETDDNILYYYCSGGGTLKGVYTKINEPIDVKQIDQRVFIKTLILQDIGFDIFTTVKNSSQQLTIQPFGLKIDNSKISSEIVDKVVNAEIEDLNSDGYPEILIYTKSLDESGYGNVIGYSVNNGKSVSQISFPDISENQEANNGYKGNDEFAIVETTLVRRFKTFNTGDDNKTPTGKIRQIQYKLKQGEAGRNFVIDKITEF